MSEEKTPRTRARTEALVFVVVLVVFLVWSIGGFLLWLAELRKI